MRVALAGVVLAVAAVPAQALETDVVLSGTFGASISQFDSDVAGSDLDIENNASRFGIFASTEEGGMKAFLNYDRAASNDGAGKEDVREFYAGLATPWGTVTGGRKSTEYRLAGVRVDPFYDTSLAGFSGAFASEGASYGLSGLTNNVFTDNTVAYESPAYWGVTGNLAAYINNNSDEQGQGDDHSFGVGANYANPAWNMTAGVQYLEIGGPDETGVPTGGVAGFPADSGSALRVSGTYAWNAFSFGASYEMVDVDSEDDSRTYGFVSGTFQFTEKIRIAAAYGMVDGTEDAAVPFDGDGATLGAFYEVFKNLNLYAGGRGISLDDDDTTTFAAGASYSFDVDLE